MTTSITRVADVMQTDLHMVSGLSSVSDALKLMREELVSSLVIERRDEDDEYGVVTIQDIAGGVVARNRSAHRTSVHQIMTKPALTISADMNVKYAIRLLARFGLTRALVTKGKHLEGLVTLRDLVLSGAEFEDDGA